MDDLRWILAGIGIVLLVAIYFSSRFEREEWRRDREGFTGFSKPEPEPQAEMAPVHKTRVEPQLHSDEEHHSTDIENQKPGAVTNEVVDAVDDIRVDEAVIEAIIEPVDVRVDEILDGILEEDTRRETQHSAVKNTVTEENKEDRAKSDTVAERTEQPAESSTSRHQAVGIRGEDDVKKALEMSEPDSPADTEVKVTTGVTAQAVEDDWQGIMDSAREPLIEDEIVNVEIPEELSELEKKPEEVTERNSYESTEQNNTELNVTSEADIEMEEPVQQELLLEIEPLVLVLTVMAKAENLLEGKSIRAILEAAGLQCDDRGIYQFHMTGKKEAIFGVVSVIEPGVFNVETINEYETPGLSFFCQLPGPLTGKDMFRIMQMKALNIAEKLGGQLCDDKRNLLTEQATTHYNDRITEFDREIVLARKKQG